jgi:hypothetical protein
LVRPLVEKLIFGAKILSLMIILQIEHQVVNFESWKKAFDNDPIDRKKSGVKRYRVYRSNEDPNLVIIDLEFDELNSARQTLAALRNLWPKIEGIIVFTPHTRILEIVDIKEY